MFLMINNKRYSCKKRIPKTNSVKFLSVSPTVEDISGKIQMFRNDGFLLSEDVAENYTRRFMTGSLLTLTNEPEKVPTTPQPTLEQEMAAAIKEGVDSV